MGNATGETLLLRVKDSKTGKEGWMKADKFVEAIGESMIESGFLKHKH